MAKRLRKAEPADDAAAEQALREKVDAAAEDLRRRVDEGRPSEDAVSAEELIEGWKRRRRS